MKKNDTEDLCVLEFSDSKQDLVLIQAPKLLVTQFFHHWGHPLRSNLPRDRWNERISMVIVAVIGAFFPVSWIAFMFAPNSVRLMWVGFQLYNLLAMSVLIYGNYLRVGSLEETLAEALHTQQIIRLGDPDTGYIVVSLKQLETSRIAEAREVFEAKKSVILGTKKDN